MLFNAKVGPLWLISLVCPFHLSEVDTLLLLGLVSENWSTISMSTSGRTRKNTTAQYRRDRQCAKS